MLNKRFAILSSNLFCEEEFKKLLLKGEQDMFRKYKNRKAFTLVEFMVAALIIAVLVAIATPIFRKTILKARAAEAINLLTQVRTKQYQNYARKKAYFVDFGDMAGKLTNSDEIRDSENSSKLIIGDYEVELVGDSDCAIAHYKPDGATEAQFSFSVSYLKNGLGCDGSICQTFGDVIGGVDDVCAGLEQADYSCPNNFDPTTCSFPKVLSIDGCSCVCSDFKKMECQSHPEATWDEENCFCDFTCHPTENKDQENSNWWWDEEGCTWRCALTLNACGERETYDENSCSCICTYGTDSNGNCACPSGQIWDGQTCIGCEYNFYMASNDVNVCCTEEAPIFDGTECVPCPAKSTWNPESKLCECENVVNGVCQCPDDRPMWNGTACVECAYQFYTPVGDIGVCCTAEKPVASGNSCVACPSYSTWNAGTKTCVCNEGHIPVYDGNGVLTSCGCPTGLSTGYHGEVVAGACKCPANTNTTQTGGEVGTTGCHCPAEMSWQPGSGVDGGYCKCDDGSTRMATSWYSSNDRSWHSRGIACCPTGTVGYALGSQYGTQASGYDGAIIVGEAQTANFTVGDACFCPTGTGPRTSDSYQGTVVNETCACSTGTTWYEGSGCLKCPPGSTWNEHCSKCLCNQTDGYATYGPYDQTNGCTQKMCKGAGYYDVSTCSCGCIAEDTYYDSDLECCRCPAQAGIGHDENHDINGCYIGSN